MGGKNVWRNEGTDSAAISHPRSILPLLVCCCCRWIENLEMLFDKFLLFLFFFYFLVFAESQRNQDEKRCGTVAAPPRVLPRPAQVYTNRFVF
jgi:hypothetical protein